jgi:hypothetical protein
MQVTVRRALIRFLTVRNTPTHGVLLDLNRVTATVAVRAFASAADGLPVALVKSEATATR